MAGSGGGYRPVKKDRDGWTVTRPGTKGFFHRRDYDRKCNDPDLPSRVAEFTSISGSVLVRYVDVFSTPKAITVVTDDVGSARPLRQALKQAPRPMTEADVLTIFLQVVVGVLNLHASGHAHGNLSKRNILVMNRDIIQLTEFGLHRLLGHNFSPPRKDPAMIPPREPETPAADSWALGAVLYQLCSRMPPAMPDPFATSACAALRSYSTRLKDLMRNLLGRDPAKRYSPRRILRLPFIHSQLPRLFRGICRLPPSGVLHTLVPPPPPPSPRPEGTATNVSESGRLASRDDSDGCLVSTVTTLQPSSESSAGDDDGTSVLFLLGCRHGEADARTAEVYVVPEVDYDERLCEEKASDFLARIMCIMLEPEG
jgi:serine/threonine protein kinase